MKRTALSLALLIAGAAALATVAPATAGPRASPAYVCPAPTHSSPYCDCEAGCECTYDSCIRQCPSSEDIFSHPCWSRCQSDFGDCMEVCAPLGAESCGFVL